MSNVLIDTEALIWFANGSSRLSAVALAIIDDASIQQFASAASIWEMAIKIPLGKLVLKTGSLGQFVQMLHGNEIKVLPITTDDTLRVAELPHGEHKDPFDRLIAAQCLRRDFALVSNDAAFDAYGVPRI